MTGALVNSPDANSFRELHSTTAGLKASLGDPEKHDGSVKGAIIAAHRAASEVLSKVAKLPKDETRTTVAKHHTAAEIFVKGEQVILQSQANLAATAAALEAEAEAEMKAGFETDEKRAAIHTEIRAWIRETAKGENGLADIRKAMMNDFEVAAVICHSPRFLLGLSDTPLTNMILEAVKRYKPKANAKLDRAIELKALAKKYSRFVLGLGSSSFNRAMADKYRNRVEV
jgi:hypothetical protein